MAEPALGPIEQTPLRRQVAEAGLLDCVDLPGPALFPESRILHHEQLGFDSHRGQITHHGLGVGPAARIPALCALGLRQEFIDALDELRAGRRQLAGGFRSNAETLMMTLRASINTAIVQPPFSPRRLRNGSCPRPRGGR